MSPSTIERHALLNAALGARNVTNVDIRRITLGPGQKSGRHLHPCPVVGYIASGTGFYQIEGEPAQLLPVGSAFYEPAEKVIADFGNASDVTPMTFIAFYLLDGEQDLITMLENK
ncbi:MAG TPA: cupin domain-containing protein [Terracidiphilus sp.]|nr:cupin domain-containing protein [Terracidiphilus sp.]